MVENFSGGVFSSPLSLAILINRDSVGVSEYRNKAKINDECCNVQTRKNEEQIGEERVSGFNCFRCRRTLIRVMISDVDFGWLRSLGDALSRHTRLVTSGTG